MMTSLRLFDVKKRKVFQFDVNHVLFKLRTSDCFNGLLHHKLRKLHTIFSIFFPSFSLKSQIERANEQTIQPESTTKLMTTLKSSAGQSFIKSLLKASKGIVKGNTYEICRRTPPDPSIGHIKPWEIFQSSFKSPSKIDDNLPLKKKGG
jgi:hypothetical protein